MRFADDINLLGGSEEELQLTETLEKKTAADYCMEISSHPQQKQNSRQLHQAKIIYQYMDDGKTLEEVDQFRYLGSTQTKGSKDQPLSSIDKASDL